MEHHPTNQELITNTSMSIKCPLVCMCQARTEQMVESTDLFKQPLL